MRIRIVHVEGNREVFECEICRDTTIEEVKTFYHSKTGKMRDEYNFVIYDPATGKGIIIDDGICTGSSFASMVADKLQPYVTVFIYNKGVRILNEQSILRYLQDSYLYLLAYLIGVEVVSAARRMEPLTIVVNASAAPLIFSAPAVTRARAMSIPGVRSIPSTPSTPSTPGISSPSSISSIPGRLPSASTTPISSYSTRMRLSGAPVVPSVATSYVGRMCCQDTGTTFSQASYTESFFDPRTVASASIHTPTTSSRRFLYPSLTPHPSLTPSRLTTDFAADRVEFTEGLQVPATYIFSS